MLFFGWCYANIAKVHQENKFTNDPISEASQEKDIVGELENKFTNDPISEASQEKNIMAEASLEKEKELEKVLEEQLSLLEAELELEEQLSLLETQLELGEEPSLLETQLELGGEPSLFETDRYILHALTNDLVSLNVENTIDTVVSLTNNCIPIDTLPIILTGALSVGSSLIGFEPVDFELIEAWIENTHTYQNYCLENQIPDPLPDPLERFYFRNLGSRHSTDWMETEDSLEINRLHESNTDWMETEDSFDMDKLYDESDT